MNKKDLLIVSQLRNNARMSLTKMSRETRIPVSTIFDRLKVQEDTLIRRHVSLVDFSMLGYNTKASIAIKVKKEQKEQVKQYLITHQNVNSVYKINNGFDFLIEGIFRHIKDLEKFMDLFEEKFDIIQQQTFYIIDDIARERFMSKPELIELLN